MKLIEAIAKMEGFGVDPTNRPTRNNNPGDIEFGPFAKAHGADRIESPAFPGEKPRFAHFPSVEAGFAAMRALLLDKYSTFTVAAMIAKYAPPNENDTKAYITRVCEDANVTPEAIVGRFL